MSSPLSDVTSSTTNTPAATTVDEVAQGVKGVDIAAKPEAKTAAAPAAAAPPVSVNYNDAQFRAAFDPTSGNYHNGIKMQVDMGGQRVPKGMEDHADWMNLPEQEYKAPSDSDFGPKYLTIATERKQIDELKKAVAAVLPATAAVLKYEVLLEKTEAADELDEKKQAKCLRFIAKQVKIRDAKLLELKSVLEEKWADGNSSNPNVDKYAPGARLVLEEAVVPRMGKAKHVQFTDKTKKLTQKMFGQMRHMMQDLKAAKKEFLAQSKE